jgi:ribonuclease P protein subunit POP4
MIRHDLVGRDLKVVDAHNNALVGITGKVVDETKSTLRVRTDRGEKTLLKEQVTIEVDGTRIEGELLTQRPEKRTRLRTTQWQRKKQNK